MVEGNEAVSMAPSHPCGMLQLALATLLAGLVAAPGRQGPAPPPPQLYDPAFSSLDRQLLARLGMEVIEQDERGARRATSPTLFYLPHCEVRRPGVCGGKRTHTTIWKVTYLAALVVYQPRSNSTHLCLYRTKQAASPQRCSGKV